MLWPHGHNSCSLSVHLFCLINLELHHDKCTSCGRVVGGVPGLGSEQWTGGFPRERASLLLVPSWQGNLIPLRMLRECNFTIFISPANSGQGQPLGQVGPCICSSYRCSKGNVVGMLVSVTLALRTGLQYLVMYFYCCIRDKDRLT